MCIQLSDQITQTAFSYWKLVNSLQNGIYIFKFILLWEKFYFLSHVLLHFQFSFFFFFVGFVLSHPTPPFLS